VTQKVPPIRLLNLEPEHYSERAREILNSFAQVDERPLPASALAEELRAYDGVILRLGHRLNGEALGGATRLKVVATPTTGLDHLDVTALERLGITVISLRGERAFLDTIRATAEHTMTLLLALTREIPWAYGSVLRGQWDRDPYRGNELFGKTMGIVGLGRLGRQVAGYGLAFGMRILAHNKPAPVPRARVRNVSLETLLRQSHVVSLHVPLTRETEGLIGGRELALMRPEAILVNTSRGGVVDEEALLRALERGELAGAALDVLRGEPGTGGAWDQEPPLLAYARNHENLLLTPHIGGAAHGSMEKTEVFLAEKIRDYFACATG